MLINKMVIMIISLSFMSVGIAEPGMPDKPGEATAKMIAAGVLTEEGVISEFTQKEGFFPTSKESKKIRKDYKAFFVNDVKIYDKQIDLNLTCEIVNKSSNLDNSSKPLEDMVIEQPTINAIENPLPEFGGCERCHQDVATNFTTSLHYTGTGMKREYEKGAAGHFGIDMDEYYDQWDCSKCHVVSCTKCHIGGDMYGVHNQEMSIATCDPCHKKKQTSTFVGDMPAHKKKAPHADIHYEKGLICIDCHTADEIHGTGVMYETQLEVVTVECEDCHESPGKVVKEMNVTQYTLDSRVHGIHDGKLDCIACHTGWSLTCNGCHLDTRKGTKPVSDEFYLGIAVDGLVTTFLKMDATYNNETHTGYGEWFSHTITDKPKDCDFCHEDRKVLCDGVNAQIIGEGGSFISQETIDWISNIDTSLPDYKQEVKETWFDKWILKRF